MFTTLFLTWDVTKIPVDAEVGIRGDDSALKNLLADHRGKRVFGCMDIGLNQPRVLWTFEGQMIMSRMISSLSFVTHKYNIAKSLSDIQYLFGKQLLFPQHLQPPG